MLFIFLFLFSFLLSDVFSVIRGPRWKQAFELCCFLTCVIFNILYVQALIHVLLMFIFFIFFCWGWLRFSHGETALVFMSCSYPPFLGAANPTVARRNMTLPGENGQNLVEWRFRKEQTRGKVIVFGRKLRVRALQLKLLILRTIEMTYHPSEEQLLTSSWSSDSSRISNQLYPSKKQCILRTLLTVGSMNSGWPGA